jgi:AraC family transcriptional activator FtrA
MASAWPVLAARASGPKDNARYDPDISRERRKVSHRTHRVAVLAFEGLAPFDLGVAVEIFAPARPELEVPWWYSFAVCAERPGPLGAMGGFQLIAPYGLETLAAADTVIVPGCADVRADPSPELAGALRCAHANGARLVSICSGAFTLAAAGLLDGREAATHWLHARLLQERFPRVRVNADVLYVDGGDVLTSAGTAAGIDLCLHLIRRDHGAEIANRIARQMVVAAHRDGGQAQFIEAPVPRRIDDDPIASTVQWALERLGDPLTVGELARRSHLSPRQFSRRFRAATGTSPGGWLLRQRLQASLTLLERSDASIEAIGRLVGLPSAAGFRRHFRDAFGVPPSSYRRNFQAMHRSGPSSAAPTAA